MRRLFLAILALTLPLAAVANEFQVGKPFEVEGAITNFYGWEKSAEGIMWSKALTICAKLGGGQRSNLLVNRVSDVAIVVDNTRPHQSIARATFECNPTGSGK